MAGKQDALKHLADFVSTKSEDAEFTLERLMDLVDDHDALRTAEIVASLVKDGKLEQFVRVESTLGSGGIDDFPSLLAVPEKIYDWRTQKTVDVTLDNLRIMYRPKALHSGG